MKIIDRSGCAAKTHGRATDAQNYGCRCPDARRKRQQQRAARRRGEANTRVVDGAEAARQLQSLVADGHPLNGLAARLEITPQRIGQLAHRHAAHITRGTAAMIGHLFDELDGTDGGSAVARAIARRNGWRRIARPDTSEDPAVARQIARARAVLALKGEPLQLNQAERVEAVRIGYKHGLPYDYLMATLRVSGTTMRALRAEAGVAA